MPIASHEADTPAPPRHLAPITLADIRAARDRIERTVTRTPLIRLDVDAPCRIWLKLETLQPIGSFKLRGALNAMRMLPPSELSKGVYTASAGNMAQGVAWGARELGVPCTVIMPDSAPATKRQAVERLGARTIDVSYAEWWQTLMDHGRADMSGAFIHPVADRDVIAGNGTIGLEIAEDCPDATAVLVPFGGGGLITGIGTAIRALAPAMNVYACEVATAAPLSASLAAEAPVTIDRVPSFVDGIGGQSVLDTMWPLVQPVIDGAIVAALDDVKRAIRLLVERARVVAEGAGATSVAAALTGRIRSGKVVCVVSGGNIDVSMLIGLLSGSSTVELPPIALEE